MKELKYYCFDFDDNILHLDTKILIEKYEDDIWKESLVSTEEYASIRMSENVRFINDDIESAFINFTDKTKDGDKKFLIDAKNALEKELYAPSWNKLIECLTNGNIFAIITARGHEPRSIRYVIEYIIDNYVDKKEMVKYLKSFFKLFSKSYTSLTDEELISKYLDTCYYYGVTSDSFRKIIDSNMSSPEEGKVIAMEKFVSKVDSFAKKIDRIANIGFSDDDIKNVKKIKNLFEKDLSNTYPNIKFNIYNTNDKDIPHGIRYKI